jgi:hypothetical protein
MAKRVMSVENELRLKIRMIKERAYYLREIARLTDETFDEAVAHEWKIRSDLPDAHE